MMGIALCRGWSRLPDCVVPSARFAALRLAAIVVVIALGLWGCGGVNSASTVAAGSTQESTAAGSAADDIGDVFGQYTRAVTAGDGERACGLMSFDAQQRVAAAAPTSTGTVSATSGPMAIGRSCSAVLSVAGEGDALPRGPELTHLVIDGGHARGIAGSEQGRPIEFVLTDAGWKVQFP